MQSTLAEFQETQSTEAFALQNSKLLKVHLDQVTIQSKLGAMVAYQGEVSFEHAGSGGMSRMLKKAVTGEGTQLMKMSGAGEVNSHFSVPPYQNVELKSPGIHTVLDSTEVMGKRLVPTTASFAPAGISKPTSLRMGRLTS